ncbi:MAG: hypothetical protein K9M01_04265 [Candidatus Omnitrophica bacterium]|nr:hypothetical protein [Candidatus Omnitrophota bacterium]
MKKNILSIIFILIVSSFCFAQERFFLPKAKSPQELKLERAIKDEKKSVRNSGYLDSLNIYLALRRQNSSVCKRQDCRDSFKNLLPFRYMAEGRCQEIKNKLQKKLCLALQEKNCSNFAEPLNNFCRSFLNKDVNLLKKIGGNREFSRRTGGSMSKEDILEMLAVYYGFKDYSIIACEKFLQKENLPLSLKLSCSIIFSEKPRQQIDDIMDDLAFFNLSRKKNNLDFCDSIDNYLIKNKCQTEIDKDLSEIW